MTISEKGLQKFMSPKKVTEILLPPKKSLQNFMFPKQKRRKKDCTRIKTAFCSFSGGFHACYILKYFPLF